MRRYLLSLGCTVVLLACRQDGEDGGGGEAESGHSHGTCDDGCVPDFGAGEESTGTTSGSESGTATESESTGETESTSDTDSGSTTSGAGECPEQLPGGEEACAGKMACKYGEQCCLCDPDMGCDTWTCQPPFAGVFCPDEYPGVGAPCPMEAISCSYCVADDPALICLGGEWSPMLWCF